MNTTPKRSSLKGVILLNMGLLVLLAIITFSSTHAGAQNQRGRGDYVMVAGGARGTESSVVYVVDQVNQEMMALTYDSTNKRLDGMTYRNLANDARTMLRSRATGN
ncbi:MAG TPA: hypothetical protein VG711_10950 [Phycisphaerales bacterium]|nr:hypothetical protein [Phycisphaerales bacterium]